MLAAAKRPSLALDVNIVQDNLPIEVAPRVFIGSIHAAFNQEALLSLKITHVSSLKLFEGIIEGRPKSLKMYYFIALVIILTETFPSLQLQILNASRLPPSFPKNFTYLSVDVRDK